MHTIREVMSTTLLTVDATETISDAAAQMDGRGVGAALVMNGEHLSGILTERDILRAVATGQDRGDAACGCPSPRPSPQRERK